MTNSGVESSSISLRRRDFPSLRRLHNGVPLAYFDGPAGTQVPQQVIDAMVRYYTTSNANTHGRFVTSAETDEMLERSRQVVADFLGAENRESISFGANMTTLAFSLSKAIGRSLKTGDEIVVTQLDHEANRGPWLLLGERGIVVREIPVRPDATLDEQEFRSTLNARTRLVAMGWASNAFGTVNNVALARELTRKVGAWLLVDAVHYAPHFPIDVRAVDIDFLFCSSYKFYGPHVGVLYVRKGLLDLLQTDRLRTQEQRAPYRIETGTLNHAAIAGTSAAVEYIASLGGGAGMRERIVSGMNRLSLHEHTLAAQLYAGLSTIDGVRVHGQTFASQMRAPTIAFTVGKKNPEDVSARLAERGICTWHGHFYAIRPMEILGLLDTGGVTRVGISLYNTAEEVSRLLLEVRRLAGGR